jgi:hypothetical protein
MKQVLWVVFSTLILIHARAGDVLPSDDKGGGQQYLASNDKVIVTPVAIRMPLGRILLVRKDRSCCAVKFTKFWTGKTEQDWFADYVSYYQGDGTGDLSKKTVEVKTGKLSSPKPRGIGRLAFSFGNKEVQCGPIRLFWFGHGWLNFYREGKHEGDYGIELAPTKWTDVLKVNVFDPRLTWYQYDSQRSDIEIPVEQLW